MSEFSRCTLYGAQNEFVLECFCLPNQLAKNVQIFLIIKSLSSVQTCKKWHLDKFDVKQNPNQLFSVPNISDVVMKSAYAGSVLRQVASQALNRNSQDVIFMPRQLSLNVNRLISGEFSIPEIAGLSALDKFNVSVTFLGPWSPQVPIITVVSPQGTIH